MSIKKIAVAAPTLLAIGVASMAFAQITSGTQTLPDINVFTGLDRAVNLLFTALIIGSIIFIILAAFQFVASGGDPNAVLQARSKLIYAAVGIVVALVARSVPFVIKNIIGSGLPQ